MNEELPPEENVWLRVVGGMLVACLVVALLFPGLLVKTSAPGRSETKADAVNIVAALKAYLTEYGKWPDYTGDGLFLDEKRQAQLLQTLQGKDDADNPRKIIFFEGRIATQNPSARGKYRGGFSPETGAYLDPQGNAYRIIIDANYDGQVDGPYLDAKGLPIPVIVWSLGKDGQQGAPGNPRTLKGSDDVVSW